MAIAFALILVLVVLGSVLFHVLSPWWMTPIASNWGYIDGTIKLTFLITGAGYIAIILFIAYCVFRFRHQEGSRATYQPENNKLEWALGIGTTVAVLALLGPGLFVWYQFVTVPKGAAEIEVVGQQWEWTYRLIPGQRSPFLSYIAEFFDAPVDGVSREGLKSYIPPAATADAISAF